MLRVVEERGRFYLFSGGFENDSVRYHTGGSMKLNTHILHLAHMVYL
jgi:hypothetical protein